MPVFRLDKFPNVCRLCLKSDIKQKLLVPLSTKDEVLDGTIADFIQAYTFEISENKSHLFPNKVCLECLDHLKFFAKYQSRLTVIHRLMDALAELRLSNSEPMKQLFDNQPDKLVDVFNDLELCTKSEITVQDLLDEFPFYEIAACSESDHDEIESISSGSCQDLVADEMLGIWETVMLSPGPSAKRAKKVEQQQEDDVPIEQPINEGPTPEHTGVKPKPKRRTAQTLMSNRSRDTAAATDKQFVCDSCGWQFKVRQDLEKHQQRHSNLLNYTCSYCRKGFNVKEDLNRHIKIQHDADTSFKCEICGLEFRSAFARSIHQKNHSVVYDIPCNLCEKKFKCTKTLKRHCQAVHQPRRHLCQHCPKTFSNRTNLVDHVEAVHKVQMRFICDVCVKTYPSQEALDVHKILHSNPAPLQCGTCLKVYPSKERLQDHPCITYREDYVCCGRDFRSAYPYNTHMFKTHGQRTKP